MTIRSLFDSNKDITRPIEKVISFATSQEDRLRTEISEYVVTDSIEDQLDDLLKKMELAMDTGGQHEVGVWVSGFYGSGKSSFTKYLGMAFDDGISIDGKPFIGHLQDRLHRSQTKALIAAIAKRFPASVVLLDLASEQVAGATLEEVSTVLFYKVLQWAGYSRNLKVAALERKNEKEGRQEEFSELFTAAVGVPWVDSQNDPLVVDSVLPRIAHKLYPELFPAEDSFTADSDDIVYLQNDRIKEILQIVRQKSGKDYVIFVVDEIGQYVGSNQNKILDLQGLAENLKNIGDGKAWIIGTAQQTLAEDDPRAAINSPELYKLKDRFPLQVDLEASDIREICVKRLLGKSSSGEQKLGELFDKQGQALRQNTKLEDAKFYDSDLERQTFINLYPFLPAHFDILLNLLGQLAKSTGGIGLRSAIKVIQDILIDSDIEAMAVADRPVGWLATSVTLYESLEKDIRAAFSSIHHAVGNSIIRFPESATHQQIAKTVAVLQILGNIPITRSNVVSLMHEEINASTREDDIEAAIGELLADPMVPLGETEGKLQFFSEVVNEIEQERGRITPRIADTRRIFNETIKDLFDPLPVAQIKGALTVRAGIKSRAGAQSISIVGEREHIQIEVEFISSEDYEAARSRVVDDSRHQSAQKVIYMIGRTSPNTDSLCAEIYRSRNIMDAHRNDPDQEIREYCASQGENINRLSKDLMTEMSKSLVQGSFIFRGQTTAVNSLDQNLSNASKAQLLEVAEQVFNRLEEAPVRADTNLAEKFLRADNLRSITSEIDPLSLVQIEGGSPQIKTDHKALVSVKDFIERNGNVEGKRLLEAFQSPPYGWSPDTLRYLLAALLTAGELKLKVSGREITANGQQAVDALKSNNAFRSVGVSLRDDRPDNDVLARAASRLTDLTGEDVVPLEDAISKAALECVAKLQSSNQQLEGRFDQLKIPRVDRLREINQEMLDLITTDASDAPQRFGSETSALNDGLIWARDAWKAFEGGLSETLQEFRNVQETLSGLPTTGEPGDLRKEAEDDLTSIEDQLSQEGFFENAPDIATALSRLNALIAATVENMLETRTQRLKTAEEDLKRLPEWTDLTQEEQNNALNQISDLAIDVSRDIDGLKKMINEEFDLLTRLSEIKRLIEEKGREKRRKRAEGERKKRNPKKGSKVDGKAKFERAIKLPSVISESEKFDALLLELEDVKADLAFWDEFEIQFLQED
jgi:hypothetical protein